MNFQFRVRKDNQTLRTEVQGNLNDLRQDVQALAERTTRLEAAVHGLAATHHDRDRHENAA